MFEKILIANRGEIALRIQRACRELGIKTVVVHSEADRDAKYVKLADESVCIGPPSSTLSYLNVPAIISAAEVTDAQAIHPGYGFLSENADFARLCEMEKIIFVGPKADVISQMGDKVRARQLAAEAGVPTTPGSAGKLRDAAEAAQLAAQIGYPVLLKAAAGGGGRGMRVVREANELADQFADAAREAKGAFGDDAIYVEKYLSNIRHIEIQVLSDGETVLHLGERDCSIQRRNQKLLEETPSPVLDSSVRARMCEAAVKLCRHVGYTSAGTIEFILDAASGEFYFMEMNTRIQVEHPVTEMVSGIDLVKAQLEIAGGKPLAYAQEEIRFDGHAIECRINAEDSERDFAPCPGAITRYHAPGGPGIRIDSHIHAGYTVPPYYDSLLAKVVSWGRNRAEAIARMRRALHEMEVGGIKTTIPFHLGLLQHEAFVAGKVHTRFVENELLGARA
jgi:acetyl-CoA carboxylase biotin carboxylase subunit